MSTLTRQQILQQIAAIPAMERGKLSAYTFKDRSPRAISHQTLQTWEEGKNHTRFVAEQEVPAVQAALEGYAQYQELTRESVQGPGDPQRPGDFRAVPLEP